MINSIVSARSLDIVIGVLEHASVIKDTAAQPVNHVILITIVSGPYAIKRKDVKTIVRLLEFVTILPEHAIAMTSGKAWIVQNSYVQNIILIAHIVTSMLVSIVPKASASMQIQQEKNVNIALGLIQDVIHAMELRV